LYFVIVETPFYYLSNKLLNRKIFIKKNMDKISKSAMDYFISEISKEETKEKIKRQVIDPIFMYIIDKVYPYVIVSSVIFILTFLIAIFILFMLVKKEI